MRPAATQFGPSAYAKPISCGWRYVLPKHTRFVWVSQPGPQVPPVQGLVLEWRRHSYRWSALVVTVRIEAGRPVVVQEWGRLGGCGR